MVAADHHLVGDDAVEQLAARRLGGGTVLVVLAVPVRMGDDQRRQIGGVVRDHQLARTGPQMERAMAGRVAGRVDELDAGRDVRLAGDLADVLPGREHRLDATRQSLARLRQPVDHRRIGPELVLHIRDDDLGVRIDRLVGVLLHQPENVVGMAVRNQDGVDLGRIDTGGLHVGRELAGGRLHLPAGAAVAHDGLAAGLDDDDRERDRDEVGWQAGLDHRGLHVVDRSVGDEGGIVRLLPDAVVDRRHLGRTDLVGGKRLGRIGGLLRKGRRHDEPRIEAERGGKAGGNDEVTTR